MINVLEAVSRHTRWLFLLSLFLNGCTSSPNDEPARGDGHSSEKVWLQLMFQAGRAQFTPSEAKALRELLKGVPTENPPAGSPTPRLKYVVEIDIGGQVRTYYFMEDGSLMLARLPAQTADQIRQLIHGVAGRIK